MFTKVLFYCTSSLFVLWLLIYPVTHCPLLDTGRLVTTGTSKCLLNE